jgi:beta-lactamase superfamily II metal-dependent hydrolase
MGVKCVINVDLADVWANKGRKTLLRTLTWGDAVTVLKQTSQFLEVETTEYLKQDDGTIVSKKVTAFIEPAKSSGIKPSTVVRPLKKNAVLKVNFVDVQQGDGAVIETPDGKVLLLDGGDNQLFARYLAARFRRNTVEKPQEIECIVVTHGDADHFSGLTKIFESEGMSDKKKRLFMQPKRIYHNGIVKRPSTRNKKKVPDKELLGPTRETADGVFLTGLEENLLAVPDNEMNQPFLEWKQALATYDKRSKVKFRRLEFGDDKAFDFLTTEDLRIDVLGPITAQVAGKPALKFLGNPPKGPRIGHESLSLEEEGFSGLSASHTINGHSVVLRLRYGGFNYLFCGDLNDESGRFLVREHNKGDVSLRAEVLKVPHHGSADFSGAFIQAVSPVVSVVSSGDESMLKEYIHPRATLMGALGKCSRIPEPLIFVTELVAFFQLEGRSNLVDAKKAKKRGVYFGFSRSVFGLVKTRTDGKRLLVCTDSGNLKMKEAYAYGLDPTGAIQPAPVLRA